MKTISMRRALISVSDKTGIVEVAKVLADQGVEIVATGNTGKILKDAGLKVVPIEEISRSPEAFQGRMKTLSFPVCSGILYRRGNQKDEQDLKQLGIQPIDCVIVNFYPFEEAVKEYQASEADSVESLIEQIDIGGPTLVRAAAKNASDVITVVDPSLYPQLISALQNGGVTSDLSIQFARTAWERVFQYDQAIAQQFGHQSSLNLRYGENPHQMGQLWIKPDSPIDWGNSLTSNALSYNNILDLSSAYQLARDLKQLQPEMQGVVIVKHNNPCGVALVPPGQSQLKALERAWEGDPVSAFGGVLIFTQPLEEETAEWLSDRFIELVSAPHLEKESSSLQILLKKRKKLKAVSVMSWDLDQSLQKTGVVGGELIQDWDRKSQEELRSVTKKSWPKEMNEVAQFGISICRALKSNAIALVRGNLKEGFQLVGAGQGQPNRIEALKELAVPRAHAVLKQTGGSLSDCIMVSDAFFPFRDTVEESAAAGIRWIIQPGGSLKDRESIDACDENGIGMVFTGVRHFRH